LWFDTSEERWANEFTMPVRRTIKPAKRAKGERVNPAPIDFCNKPVCHLVGFVLVGDFVEVTFTGVRIAQNLLFSYYANILTA